jgi:hypothetical protein
MTNWPIQISIEISLRKIFPFFLLLALALLSSTVFALSPTYVVLSTTPNPLVANVVGTITIRQNAQGSQFPYLLYCPAAFSAASILPVRVANGVVTLEHRFSPFPPPPITGNERYCDKTFPLPPLASGGYSIRLLVGTTDIAGAPLETTTFDVGSVCVGACPTQSVPLNFSAGAPLWWLAIVSLLAAAAAKVRRRWRAHK